MGQVHHSGAMIEPAWRNRFEPAGEGTHSELQNVNRKPLARSLGASFASTWRWWRSSAITDLFSTIYKSTGKPVGRKGIAGRTEESA